MSPARPDLVARIREVQFTPVRLREGYDMGEADGFLAEIVRLTADLASVPGSPAAPPTSVISEQRGVLSRLLGRRS